MNKKYLKMREFHSDKKIVQLNNNAKQNVERPLQNAVRVYVG